jgi:hypothetical protein
MPDLSVSHIVTLSHAFFSNPAARFLSKIRNFSFSTLKGVTKRVRIDIDRISNAGEPAESA